MGYPIFGKVKTLVLPLPNETYSIEEYKNKYGIDLTQFIKLNTNFGQIDFVPQLHTMICLEDIHGYGGEIFGTSKIVPALTNSFSQYVSGSQDGIFILGVYAIGEEALEGLEIRISKDKDFSMENVKISALIY